MEIRAFITHKKAESFQDCQDRFSINCDTKSIALSDGMSQSIFQKYWAELLVTTFTSNREWIPNIESVRELSTKWKEQAESTIKQLKENKHPSAWRSERSLKEGKSAGATFLGIRFSGSNWVLDVLGDSCLVVIENHRIKDIYSSQGNSFDNYPDYFDSNPKNPGKGSLRTEEGELKPNEILLLVSDPFSDFLNKYRYSENISELINEILALSSHQDFEKLIEEWRNIGMHNDDSTLIIITNNQSDNLQEGYIDNLSSLINIENEDSTSHTIVNDIPKNAEISDQQIQEIIDGIKRILERFFCPKIYKNYLTKKKELNSKKLVPEILNEIEEFAKTYIK